MFIVSIYFTISLIILTILDFINNVSIKVLVGFIWIILLVVIIWRFWRRIRIERNLLNEVYYRGILEIIKKLIDSKNTKTKDMWNKYKELNDKICRYIVKGEKQSNEEERKKWMDITKENLQKRMKLKGGDVEYGTKMIRNFFNYFW